MATAMTTDDKWRQGWLVMTGVTNGERVAITHSARIQWRGLGTGLEIDRRVSLAAVMSGLDADLELHSDDVGHILSFKTYAALFRFQSYDLEPHT